MKVFLGVFVICFLVLMFMLDALLTNFWVLLAVLSALIAGVISLLYFQQEKLDTLEQRIELLEQNTKKKKAQF